MIEMKLLLKYKSKWRRRSYFRNQKQKIMRWMP